MTRFVMIDENLKVLDKIPDHPYAVVDTAFNNTWYIDNQKTYKFNDLFPLVKSINKSSSFGVDTWQIPSINKLIQLGDYEKSDFVPIEIFGQVVNLFQTASCGNEYAIHDIQLGTGCISKLPDYRTLIAVLLCPNYNPLRG